MASFEQVIIVGSLGRDVELKYLNNGTPVANFSVAVNSYSGQGESKTEKVKWFRVAAWRDLAERCNQYLAKGSPVMVIGTIESRAYVDKDSNPQSTLELTARDVRFLGKNESNSVSDDGGASDYSQVPF